MVHQINLLEILLLNVIVLLWSLDFGEDCLKECQRTIGVKWRFLLEQKGHETLIVEATFT